MIKIYLNWKASKEIKRFPYTDTQILKKHEKTLAIKEMPIVPFYTIEKYIDRQVDRQRNSNPNLLWWVK